MRLRIASGRKNEKGSGLIEFALASFTILLILFLIIDLGRALYAYNWLSDSARKATRFAMVRGRTCDPYLTVNDPLGDYCNVNSTPRGATAPIIDSYVRGLGIGINTDPGVLHVTSTCQVGGNFMDPLPCADPGWVQVTVAYDFHFFSPLFPLAWTMHSVSERPMQN